MKKLQYILLAALSVSMLTGCNLDFAPSDELNAEVLLQDEAGAEYVIDGCYALFRDEVDFLGYASGNTYVRHYFQMTEFQGDNCCLSGITTDPLYQAYAYKMTDDLKNVGTLWWIAYKVAYMANTVIETIEKKEATPATDQLLGEAYFLRGLVHFHMVTMFAKPYVCGRENVGVVLRTSTNTEKTTRATVGECYDQIASDLTKASELMTVAGRGNAGYASRNSALGLLSRVYLYMGEDQKVIDIVNGMLGGADASSVLDPDLANYFRNAVNSKETLFCIAHTPLETKGQSSIGSMYLNDGMGWGEIYPSDPLLNLYERYPSDVRYTAYCLPQVNDGSKIQVNFPIFNNDDASGRPNALVLATPNADGVSYDITYESQSLKVVPKTVHGEYTEYEVMYDGEMRPARVYPAQLKNRYNYPIWYMSRFSYQDGDPMLSSPVFVRWGEVILNRAEAYARSGQDAKALADVNAIRTRANIPVEGMFSANQMHGYTNVFDVVMDERRMELAFEGHRAFDVYTNKMKLDRRYPGCHPWEEVDYTDDRIQNPIPYCEYSVSGIQQNPGY